MERDGKRWGTEHKLLKADLLIEFNSFVIANLIYITAREDYYNEAPKKFEVLASNNNDDFVSLFEKDEVSWNSNEKKMFMFKNDVPFIYYKIIFYTNDQLPVSIAELNLCET